MIFILVQRWEADDLEFVMILLDSHSLQESSSNFLKGEKKKKKKVSRVHIQVEDDPSYIVSFSPYRFAPLHFRFRVPPI